jgi:hypothetical protein
MKKMSLLIMLMFCSICLVFSQSYPQYKEYTFHYYGFGAPPCYIAYSSDCKTSHGSPCYTYYPGYQPGVYDFLKLEADKTNGKFKSEGIFLDYSFKKCHKYRIEINLKDANGSPWIFVFAANNLSEKIDTACKLGDFPSIFNKKQIGNNNAVCSGLPVPGKMCARYFPSQNSFWIADKDYKQLWVTSDTSSPGSNAFVISRIIVLDDGEFEFSPPSIPRNLRVTDKGNNHITVKWDPSEGNVEKYEIFKNGALIGSSSATQITISGLTKCTEYIIDVRAFYVCYYSPKASINAETISIDTVILSKPVDLSTLPNKRLIVEASELILLDSGFHIKANNSGEFFQALIGCSKLFPNREEEELLFFGENDSSETFLSKSSFNDTIFVTKEEGIEEEFLRDLDSILDNDISVFPNPAQDILTIEYYQFTGIEEIILFDITGKPLFDYKLSGITTNINVSFLSSGVYIIKIFTHNNLFVKKLIKL